MSISLGRKHMPGVGPNFFFGRERTSAKGGSDSGAKEDMQNPRLPCRAQNAQTMMSAMTSNVKVTRNFRLRRSMAMRTCCSPVDRMPACWFILPRWSHKVPNEVSAAHSTDSADEYCARFWFECVWSYRAMSVGHSLFEHYRNVVFFE